jgi:hypothetical protein
MNTRAAHLAQSAVAKAVCSRPAETPTPLRWRVLARMWLAACGGWLALLPAAAQELAPSETQVEAAFLLNFPKYVNWPPESFPMSNSPIVIAVLGRNDMGECLRAMLEGKVVNGRPLVLKNARTEEEALGGCQILFVGAAEWRRMPDLLEKLKGTSVLTVGESDDFLEKGGVINLARRDRKFRLQVNLAAANPAHLKLSSKLLSVAEVVKGKS